MRLKATWLTKLMSENSQQTPGTLVVLDLVPWESRTSKVSQLFLMACNVSTLLIIRIVSGFDLTCYDC